MSIRSNSLLYLGVRAVVAKSFARIHVANLINFGIVPMTFADPEDYAKISQMDDIVLEDFRAAIAGRDEVILTDKTSGASVKLCLNLTSRQREILLAGGLLNYTKNQNK